MVDLGSISAELTEVVWPVAYRMTVAFLCGAIVGAERESKGKPAGLRTNILICLGATLFTIASDLMARLSAEGPQETTRIAAQIVTGVGFLGAGAILRSGRGVHGLTTAATIWLVAAIGMIVGIGFPLLGLGTALMTVLTLTGLGRIEQRIIGACDMRTMEVHLGRDETLARARLEAILESAVWPTQVERVQTDENGITVAFRYCARHASHRSVLWDLGQGLR
ncbi:MAG: MgtC/SapB family protein [Deferrisomatales bacterium]|nr:MgtC/SapB family protein [Deferrisomatales bacterium]